MAHVVTRPLTLADVEEILKTLATLLRAYRKGPTLHAMTKGKDTFPKTLHFSIVIVVDVEGASPEVGCGCWWAARAVISPRIGQLKKW